MAIPWLPILTAGSTLLGSIFGNNTTETQNQNQTSQQVTAGTTKLTGTQTTNQTQNQTSNQSSTQNSNENQNTSQLGSANVSRLDSQTLNQVTEQVRSLIAGMGGSTSAVQGRLNEVTGQSDNFDADTFISGVMAAANDTISSGMESDLAKMEGNTGASRRSNSNSALLASKIRNSAGAQMAGIKADATAKASEIQRVNRESKTGQITNLAAGADSSALNLLGSLLQASEQQTNQQTGNTSTVGSTSGTTTGNTNTTIAETSTQQQEQNQGSTTTGQTKTTASGKKNEGGNIFDTIGDILGSIF